MVMCGAHYIFIEWGVVVFELRGAPFWSQSFRFAQTDGICLAIFFFKILQKSSDNPIL